MYKSWTQEEIQKLNNLQDWFRGGKIDWTKVASHFPDRNVFSCKSFYYNHIKPLGFYEGEHGEVYTSRDFVEYCYLYAITKYVDPKESQAERIKRNFVQCCVDNAIAQIPIIQGVIGADNKLVQGYEPNIKLLLGSITFFDVHDAWKDQIDQLFFQQVGLDDRVIEFKGFPITWKQWVDFVRFWSQFDTAKMVEAAKRIVKDTKVVELPRK